MLNSSIFSRMFTAYKTEPAPASQLTIKLTRPGIVLSPLTLGFVNSIGVEYLYPLQTMVLEIPKAEGVCHCQHHDRDAWLDQVRGVLLPHTTYFKSESVNEVYLHLALNYLSPDGILEHYTSFLQGYGFPSEQYICKNEMPCWNTFLFFISIFYLEFGREDIPSFSTFTKLFRKRAMSSLGTRILHSDVQMLLMECVDGLALTSGCHGTITRARDSYSFLAELTERRIYKGVHPWFTSRENWLPVSFSSFSLVGFREDYKGL